MADSLPRTEISRIGDGKKIVNLEYIAEEQLVMVIAGRQRQVKLIPVRALGGDDVEWLKVTRPQFLFRHAAEFWERPMGYL